MKKRTTFIGVAAGAIAGAALAASASIAATTEGKITIITLTQTGCQFIESENGIDHMFKTMKKGDCDKINAMSAEQRLAKAKVIMLKPGKYIFRVTNRDVPYTLGFWLRTKGYDWRNPIHKFTKISVSGGGMETGKTLEYKVTLKPGEYLYSCPLNTTPDYRLVVKN
ncbi:MAG: hypothetical protein O7I42_10820 [Alphaproteobacteria bacterium]|nr:hypothetical protein [Alphaproteobacteria bacterium]